MSIYFRNGETLPASMNITMDAERLVNNLQRSCFLKIALSSVNQTRKTDYNTLKPLQSKTILSSLDCDSLSILPTGYGKSLIFECLPRVVSCSRGFPASILLISPLNSIIKEQATRYNEGGIQLHGELLHELRIHDSVCSSKEGGCFCSEPVRQFTTGNFLIAIGHPEQYLDKLVCKILLKRELQEKISHIVIDEAHCVDKWGEDFRKDFAKIKQLRSVLPNSKILALTATASKSTQEKIKSCLAMENTITIQACIVRENIKLSVLRRPSYVEGSEESFQAVIHPFAKELQEKKGNFPKTIIYANLKWCGEGYQECLRYLTDQERQLVAQYHSPCTKQMKDHIVDSMAANGKIRLLFATEAFSMGTDAPNISRIIHFGVPKTIESFIQEVGRAGRDGSSAQAVMYFNNNDIAKNVVGLERNMAELCKTDECRWDFLCNHFGCLKNKDEESGHSLLHNCCDNCEAKCTCSDCSVLDLSESEEVMISPCISSGLQTMLVEYFQAENDLIIAPRPALISGLTENLATDIVNCYANGTDFTEKLFFLKKTYFENISAIVNCYKQME